MKIKLPLKPYVKRIWDNAPHNAMTDLIVFKGAFFCCFREGLSHAGDNGSIRILKSADGKDWKPVALLSKPGFDLRDPHFSIMPDGRLMLTLGGSIYAENEYQGCLPQVAFSANGKLWSDVHEISLPEEWIWRVTWHKGKGYGFSYRLTNPKLKRRRWILTLFETDDGVTYAPVNTIKVTGYPSEATIRFSCDGTAIALLRRRRHAWIGTSVFPYKKWKWKDSGHKIGGPNFIILPDGSMWAGGRDSKLNADTSLGYPVGEMKIGPMSNQNYTPAIYLKSGGDNSYPGLVYKNNFLYVSYYSSHEKKACIYIAKIPKSLFKIYD